jgi:hypothetical protein
LLINVLSDLSDRLPKRVIDLPADYKRLTDEEQLASLLLDLVSGAKDFEKVTLLLLDDYDAMPDEKRGWFEKRVLGQLVRTKKAVVILTSEFELRFTDIDLRMRLENHELLALGSVPQLP